MVKTISLELSGKGIGSAIREIRAYKLDFEQKVEAFQKRVAERIEAEALSNFAGAVCNDIVGGGVRTASVGVSIQHDGAVSLIIASGSDAVFCEFGAGVYHNGAVGSSPHPKGSELGMTIGSYGQGRGARRVWGYYEDSQLVLTRGTPASMPMYNALKAVCDEILTIAQEVFS